MLDALEANLRRNPRHDLRDMIITSCSSTSRVSGPDQVARIRQFVAIVSGNPYSVTALADQYGKSDWAGIFQLADEFPCIALQDYLYPHHRILA